MMKVTEEQKEFEELFEQFKHTNSWKILTDSMGKEYTEAVFEKIKPILRKIAPDIEKFAQSFDNIEELEKLEVFNKTIIPNGLIWHGSGEKHKCKTLQKTLPNMDILKDGWSGLWYIRVADMDFYGIYYCPFCGEKLG